MQRNRAVLVSSILVFSACYAVAGDVKQIRAIVPSAAGATPDTVMRLLTQEISAESGKTFVVDNKPGASGLLGMGDFYRQKADGDTIAYVNNVTLSINRSTFNKLPYDPKKLVPVSLLMKVPNVIVVNNNVTVKNLQELLDYAKKNPNKLAFASPGQGTSGHLAGELLAMKTGVTLRHIPYRGSPQAITDLLGGQFDMLIDNIPNVLPYIEQGKLKAIAVTSLNRNARLPDVPTIAESGYPKFEAVAWGGIAMPPGTSEKAALEMNQAFAKAMQAPKVKKYFSETGTEIVPAAAPSALSQYAEEEAVKWAAAVKQAGLTPQ